MRAGARRATPPCEVEPGHVADQDADEPRAQPGQPQARQQAGGGAAAAEGDDDVRGLGNFAGAHLIAELERGLDVADAPERDRATRRDRIGRARPSRGTVGHEPAPRRRNELAKPGATWSSAPDAAQPLELGAHVLGLGCGTRTRTVRMPSRRAKIARREPVVRPERAAGEDGPAFAGAARRPAATRACAPCCRRARCSAPSSLIQTGASPRFAPKRGQLADRRRPAPRAARARGRVSRRIEAAATATRRSGASAARERLRTLRRQVEPDGFAADGIGDLLAVQLDPDLAVPEGELQIRGLEGPTVVARAEGLAVHERLAGRDRRGRPRPCRSGVSATDASRGRRGRAWCVEVVSAPLLAAVVVSAASISPFFSRSAGDARGRRREPRGRRHDDRATADRAAPVARIRPPRRRRLEWAPRPALRLRRRLRAGRTRRRAPRRRGPR